MTTPFFKDEALDRLAAYGNVAQFASFDPNLVPRYSRILTRVPNEKLDVRTTVTLLLSASIEGKVNIRSFRPESYQGNEFIYGLSDLGKVVEHVERLAQLGLYVIVNETVDVNDGGVSGVSLGNVIEFAPRGTPRVVDTGRAVSVRVGTGLTMLAAVYGFAPEISFPSRFRVEFSIHPIKRGWRQSHTIIWELEEVDYQELQPNTNWPNDFSEFIGDKVFGLLLAYGEGYNVPFTRVVSRQLPPFSFGRSTGTDSIWVRTAPLVPTPGLFTTVRGWTDPFKLLTIEDPSGDRISSVLVQEGVRAEYSGAVLTGTDDKPIIEGVPGYGDSFMLGNSGPTNIPERLQGQLHELHNYLRDALGRIRLEWVFDGQNVWILQLQQEAITSKGSVIFDGTFKKEVAFRAEGGLEELRSLAAAVAGTSTAIRLIGNVGITSHMADVLRRAKIPSRLVRSQQ